MIAIVIRVPISVVLDYGAMVRHFGRTGRQGLIAALTWVFLKLSLQARLHVLVLYFVGVHETMARMVLVLGHPTRGHHWGLGLVGNKL